MGDKYYKKLLSILTPIILFASISCICIEKIPNTIFIRSGETLKNKLFVEYYKENAAAAVSNIGSKNYAKEKVDAKLFGFFKIKTVEVDRIPDMSLYPGGNNIGVKLETKGVEVVALSQIKCKNGEVISPAAKSGIMVGDNIIKIDNKEIKNAEMLSQHIDESQGQKVQMEIERKNERIILEAKPVKSEDSDRYKIGLWVRDSTAGVGTLTFYDEKTRIFGALGHPVTDVDTGKIINISEGQVINSSIISIRKGVKGSPGELKGIFINEDNKVGTVYRNTECGIFGKADNRILKAKNIKPIKIALRNEIKTGKASIITTIDESGPKKYDIIIEKLLKQNNPGPKSMVIKITDPALLKKTGGIVQGMSGSPIIQNNKLVGAVTHVLIDKPNIGYGIYIEWMIRDSNILNQ
ncbi:SpoIVB peptidase [Clostridium oryzae]|uniref:SpoIVB peptidase n=1 Tax=Clostridium oryzae TaxID=1450648 RepID=A0A1V4IT59_9CLOT|nr:SpoIVB peptidase [Clostridium oryzae]OPJ63192.1 SpoIVB peptidase precursor [Clostridium oryzae]